MQRLRNIYYLTAKELRVLCGDPLMMFLVFFMFTFMVLAAAQNTMAVRNAKVAVVDLDRSPLSYRIVAGLRPPEFQRPIYTDSASADALMDKGEVDFTLQFPPHFERQLLAGQRPEAQLLIDATAMTMAGIGSDYIGQIFNRELRDLFHRPPTIDQLPFNPVLRLRYNQNFEDLYFMPVMEIITEILIMDFLLVGAAVIREREHGTMEHLLVMPVNALEIMLAKMLANGLVVFIASMLSLWFVVHKLVGAPLHGSLWLYGLGLAAFLFSLSALAIMLATIAPAMQQFGLLMIPIFMMLILFSGSQSPRTAMPIPLQWASEHWPTTQFAYLSQKVLFRGAGWAEVWEHLLSLNVMGLLCLLLALWRFRKMLEQQG